MNKKRTRGTGRRWACAVAACALSAWSAPGIGQTAAAQPAPPSAHWLPLEGAVAARDVHAVYVDDRGLRPFANFNRDDARAYPAVPILEDLKGERNEGAGPYRSVAHLVALDCERRRAQNIQTRLYAQHGGVRQTLVLGAMASWTWSSEQRTDPALAQALLQRFCASSSR